MESQVDRAISNVKAIGDPTEEEVKAFVDEALQVITLVLLAQGQTEQVAQVALLQQSGIVTSNVTPFNLSAEQVKRYNSYLNNVARSYSDDTAKAIRAVLERAELESLSAQQIRSNLKDIVKLDDYRAVRLARTETLELVVMLHFLVWSKYKLKLVQR